MDLLPPALSEKLKAQWRKCGEKPDQDHVLKAWVKIFDPVGSMTWYICEQNPDNPDILYCFVFSDFSEWGYSSLSELRMVKGVIGIGLERDLHYTPLTIVELKALIANAL